MHPSVSVSRRSNRAAATACALLGALTATVSVPAPVGAAGATATPRCATSALVLWLDTTGNGAAGSSYYSLGFTNLSGHACTLLGYPGVSAVNLGGHALGSAAARENFQTPRVVTLAGGATAHAVLRIVEAGNFPASRCHEVTAAGLRVYPPNELASKVIPFPFPACSRTGPVYLSVRPVQRS